MSGGDNDDEEKNVEDDRIIDYPNPKNPRFFLLFKILKVFF